MTRIQLLVMGDRAMGLGERFQMLQAGGLVRTVGVIMNEEYSNYE